MSLELFVDPSCPFTWRTAQWAVAASRATGRELVLRPLSLAIVNEGNADVPAEYAERHQAGRRVLRVLERVRATDGDAAALGLYLAAGRRCHEEGDTRFAGLADALAEAGLGAAALDAADDPEADKPLLVALDEARALLDEAPGSPVLSFPAHGRGFWGPILGAVPSEGDGVAMLEALDGLAAVPAFAQVKGPARSS